MEDTVEEAVKSAVILMPGESRTFDWKTVKRVRVSGKQIAQCKVAGDDIEPCILVEVEMNNGTQLRWLGYEVEFDGPTWMGQNVSDPCPITGAILWLETEGPLRIHGRRR